MRRVKAIVGGDYISEVRRALEKTVSTSDIRSDPPLFSREKYMLTGTGKYVVGIGSHGVRFRVYEKRLSGSSRPEDYWGDEGRIIPPWDLEVRFNELVEIEQVEQAISIMIPRFQKVIDRGVSVDTE